MINNNQFSQFILLTESYTPSQSNVATMGNADVLELLIPQLLNTNQFKNKAITALHQVDHYMLQETEEVCSRLTLFCQQVNADEGCEVRFNQFNSDPTLNSNTLKDQKLLHLIRADKWLKGAFTWLQPNYIALAHSLELQAFSKTYQQCIEQALDTYRHFEQRNQGIDLTFVYKDNKMSLLLESPVSKYTLLCVDSHS
ncbi:hypothetical protein [Aliiglaciecola sp. LCG003]|uniref:hypothetical protein n=1 Tax=Aliiglaciecola sp. LCG003 TaxID=3053655 RepID=UPI0025726754|nr:hypothetical protein [Aliiglaciecola sp. LCG003]WJG07626.1 hypothetical protein QR722_09610 [Aliiglaciecola sp. LCG003]